MALCSTTKVVKAYLRAWVDWWPTGTFSAQDFWMQICSSRGNPMRIKLRKVIGAAFIWTIWTQRKIMVFKRKTISEKEIFSDIQFLAFNWVKCRCEPLEGFILLVLDIQEARSKTCKSSQMQGFKNNLEASNSKHKT
ncbi:hypothetical protein OSB04_018986 [Centaurea solstitialis]|uniref:Uncharacterized protein n=1 Tax=Centaurea solstitialis TaxID=347529 RepID=A0AA38T8X9_9ASTR|nr:hypothetical protein OSB04_018986 [Centaurea solstitialis]